MNKWNQRISRWVGREPGVKDRSELQRLAAKALAAFFVLILLLAILSRTTQAFTVPEVKVTGLSEGNLTFNVEGEGNLEANTVRYTPLPEGIRVNSIFVNVGTYVEEGMPLLMLDLEDIAAQLQEEQDRLHAIELQMDIESLSGDSEELTKLKLSSFQPDYDKIKERIDSLQGLLDNNGMITAAVFGRINSIDAVLGQRIPDGAEIVTGISGFRLHAVIPEEYGKYLDLGDELVVSRVGKNDKFTGNILSIVNTNDNRIEFFAKLEDGKQYTASSFVFTIQKVSSKYRNCIPLTAIRLDVEGTFVYILKEMDTLFGKEYHAERIDVKVLDHNVTQAVIEDSQLTYADMVILSSDKIINEGDKVRLRD